MAVGVYDIGDTVRLTGTFTDNAGTVADPTTVTVTVTNPAGVVTNPAATKDSVGVYHVDLTPTVSGTWRYSFSGTGGIVAASPTYELFVRVP